MDAITFGLLFAGALVVRIIWAVLDAR